MDPNLIKLILLYLMAAFYIYAGIMHFRNPKFFYRITPPLLQTFKAPINLIVGIAEILLAIAVLIPQFQSLAAWGIIALLVAVFPANWYMWQSGGAGMKFNKTFLLIRLPIQLVLIIWAYWYT